MGYSVKLSCDNCNYEEYLNLGQGIKDGKIENVLPLLSDSNKSIVEKIIKKNNMISFTFTRKFSYCNCCKHIGVTSVIDVFTKDGKILTLENECNICRSKVEIFDMERLENINLKCVKCGKGNIKIQPTSLWD